MGGDHCHTQPEDEWRPKCKVRIWGAPDTALRRREYLISSWLPGDIWVAGAMGFIAMMK